MKIFVNMIALNEADFIREAILSTIHYVDKFIVIEGAFREHYEVNGDMHSTDGTLEILDELKAQFPDKLQVYHHNSDSQLAQRNLYWDYTKGEGHVMLLQDADEVWSRSQIEKIVSWACSRTGDLDLQFPYFFKARSLTFINNPQTYSPIDFPRVWTIAKNSCNRFIEPNKIIWGKDSKFIELKSTDEDPPVSFFHYSYMHSPERFMAKKRERTKLHGFFPWELDSNNQVYREGADIRTFEGQHPEIMRAKLNAYT
jgi:glycosyltransferase involved in cell wall biosynthesis